MAKAKQLPSGSWRIRVYDRETGKYISFTSKLKGKAGKNEAEFMAKQWQTGRKKNTHSKTVGECIDEYIRSKENILSPTTIDSYKRNKKNNLNDLCQIPVSRLSEIDVQKHFNKLALTKSAKTVCNAHGLLVAVLNVYAPDIRLRTSLPKVQKNIKQLPDAVDVLRAIKGTEIELPCLLAMWQGLRMSEIRGAKKSDIKNGVLVIHDTIVTVNGQHIEKNKTKTVESTRSLVLPQRIQDLIAALPNEQDNITLLSGQAIYKRFTRLLARNGIEHMTFHDLRHMNASIMLMLGVPDKYAMERGGWSSPNIMKSVYQHTFSAERQAIDKKIDDYFSELFSKI